MGATLADGGVNPLTGERVVDAATCHYALAVMATAGLYETSGDWLYDIGLPGKSGIGGGIVTVSPGKGGLGTFAPPLDAAGNSVRGQLAAQFLSRALGLDIFMSRADDQEPPPDTEQRSLPRWHLDRAWRDLVVEVEQRVDVRDEAGCFRGSHAEQHVTAGDEQLVTQLELLSEVGRLIGTAARHECDGNETPDTSRTSQEPNCRRRRSGSPTTSTAFFGRGSAPRWTAGFSGVAVCDSRALRSRRPPR